MAKAFCMILRSIARYATGSSDTPPRTPVHVLALERSAPGVAVLAAALLVGCTRESPKPSWPAAQAPKAFPVQIRGDTVLLPVAPAELDSHRISSGLLEPDLVVTGDEIGDIAAVAESDGGHIFVLNRRDGFIAEMDSMGQFLRRLSRSGNGPGELNRPYAIVALRNELIVMQELAPGNTLSRIALSGTGLTGRGPPIVGDWLMFSQRGPNVLLDFPVQSGIEDWTRRLLADSDSTFLVEVRVADDPPIPATALEASAERSLLLRFDSDLKVLDTIGSQPAPRSIFATQGDETAPPRIAERLFSARPLWAAGSGWLAVAHGDSAYIRVTTFGQTPELVIAWPKRRSAITQDQRLAAGHWAAVYTARAFPVTATKFEHMSEARMREVERLYLGYLSFADSMPMVQSLFGAGNCLWATTFEPAMFFDGTGTTLVGLNLTNPATVIATRMQLPDLRLRHISKRWAYVKAFDGSGVPQLIRFPLPSMGC